MAEYKFIYETPRHQKLKVLFFSLLAVLAVAGAVIAFQGVFQETIGATSLYNAAKESVQDNIKEFTPIGVFYLSFLGNLFFIPLPQETFFYLGLVKGSSALWLFFFIMAGTIPAHALNYYIGTRFSPVVMSFVSKKKVYKAKRWVNKYGSLAIFLFNFLPLPSPVLTFALGIAKYNLARLFIFLLLGSALKYLTLIGIYAAFGAALQNIF